MTIHAEIIAKKPTLFNYAIYGLISVAAKPEPTAPQPNLRYDTDKVETLLLSQSADRTIRADKLASTSGTFALTESSRPYILG